MSKHRNYSNDKIYRIIGGMSCERLEGGHYRCFDRSKLRLKANSAEPPLKDKGL
jgi:hypothetical protein